MSLCIYVSVSLCVCVRVCGCRAVPLCVSEPGWVWLRVSVWLLCVYKGVEAVPAPRCTGWLPALRPWLPPSHPAPPSALTDHVQLQGGALAEALCLALQPTSAGVWGSARSLCLHTQVPCSPQLVLLVEQHSLGPGPCQALPCSRQTPAAPRARTQHVQHPSPPPAGCVQGS